MPTKGLKMLILYREWGENMTILNTQASYTPAGIALRKWVLLFIRLANTFKEICSCYEFIRISVSPFLKALTWRKLNSKMRWILEERSVGRWSTQTGALHGKRDLLGHQTYKVVLYGSCCNPHTSWTVLQVTVHHTSVHDTCTLIWWLYTAQLNKNIYWQRDFTVWGIFMVALPNQYIN